MSDNLYQARRRLDLTLKQWKVNGYHSGYNVEVEEAARNLLDVLDMVTAIKNQQATDRRNKLLQ